jgi:hypothetical protein
VYITQGGVYRVDKTGKAEKNISEKWYAKAEDIENVGCVRFASTLKM